MPVTFSPLRYPGGKTKLYIVVRPLIFNTIGSGGTYVESFAGGAGLALKLLLNDDVSRIVLNDIDENIYVFWQACLERTDELCDMVNETIPSIAEWDNQREIYLQAKASSDLERAFATLFLNRCNISGVISGGPIGGRKQNGKYLIDARYNASDIIRKLRAIGARRSQIVFYNLEATEFLNNVVSRLSVPKSFVNIDPPYFNENGPLSSEYEQDKERDKYKEWFKKHRELFDVYHLMDYWIRDNSELVQEFLIAFRKAYNAVARRMLVPSIME